MERGTSATTGVPVTTDLAAPEGREKPSLRWWPLGGDAFVDGLSSGDEERALPPLREMGGDGGRRGYHPADLARLLIWAGAINRTYDDTGACRNCPVRETCCKAKNGYRKIHRHEHEETVERIRERQAKDPLRYRGRAATVEHPFGSMMFWNEGRALLCRGEEMAGAEFSLSALAYNLKRAVAEVGVQRLVEALRARIRRFSSLFVAFRRSRALLGAFRVPRALPSRPGRPVGKFSAEFAGPTAPFRAPLRRDPRPPAMTLMAA